MLAAQLRHDAVRHGDFCVQPLSVATRDGSRCAITCLLGKMHGMRLFECVVH